MYIDYSRAVFIHSTEKLQYTINRFRNKIGTIFIFIVKIITIQLLCEDGYCTSDSQKFVRNMSEKLLPEMFYSMRFLNFVPIWY